MAEGTLAMRVAGTVYDETKAEAEVGDLGRFKNSSPHLNFLRASIRVVLSAKGLGRELCGS